MIQLKRKARYVRPPLQLAILRTSPRSIVSCFNPVNMGPISRCLTIRKSVMYKKNNAKLHRAVCFVSTTPPPPLLPIYRQIITRTEQRFWWTWTARSGGAVEEEKREKYTHFLCANRLSICFWGVLFVPVFLSVCSALTKGGEVNRATMN